MLLVLFYPNHRLCVTMKVYVKIRYVFVVLLVIFQWSGGASAWAETMAYWSDQAEISCPGHDVEHCDMVESASQTRTHCGGMTCGSPLLSPALPLMVDRFSQVTLYDMHSLPLHTGYHSSLERPPSL